ncbi:uncharacterized protein LOC116258584 [Nymphaea colorata]|uniref:uncharacterized protein LOC116258584 n=1 Tax=Nymphaea colorata TaxID=210225 RepID=UPI00129DC837|nr:uncharacterized protein LOC116258584 [Nymphaea colorata]
MGLLPSFLLGSLSLSLSPALWWGGGRSSGLKFEGNDGWVEATRLMSFLVNGGGVGPGFIPSKFDWLRLCLLPSTSFLSFVSAIPSSTLGRVRKRLWGMLSGSRAYGRLAQACASFPGNSLRVVCKYVCVEDVFNGIPENV